MSLSIILLILNIIFVLGILLYMVSKNTNQSQFIQAIKSFLLKQVSSKIIFVICLILALGLLTFIVFKEVENSKKQQSIQQSLVQQRDLIDAITRSSTQYTTKADLDKFLKDNNVNLKVIQDDLDKLHAEVISINVISANSNGYTANNIPSTNIGLIDPNPQPSVNCNGQPIPCPDPYGFLKNTQNLDLTEHFDNTNLPIGQVSFSTWNKKPWSVNILSRTYKLVNVVGTDDEYKQYFYNKFSININGKDYDLKINSAITKQEYPESKFSFYPRLFIGIDEGFSFANGDIQFTPSLSMGLVSYGQFKKLPDFSIAEVGLGYDVLNKKARIVATPVVYNIGKYLPLMNALYFGPAVHLGLDGGISLMMGVRVGL